MDEQINAFYELPEISDAFLETEKIFILLRTGKGDAENFRSSLYYGVQNEHILSETKDTADYLHALDKFDIELPRAGYLSFEAGYSLLGLASLKEPEGPELPGYFASFKNRIIFDHMTGTFLSEGEGDPDYCFSQKEIAPSENAGIFHTEFYPEKHEYENKIHTILEQIRKGETYQVNYCGQFSFHNRNHPRELFRILNDSQPVAYSAWIHREDLDILSFSPELFFALDRNGHITARPMKGTAPRGKTNAEDTQIIEHTINDPKIGAENKMIVDLLRNDTGKIANIGSVKVFDLMRPEKYATLFQLSSGVEGQLKEGIGAGEILTHLFPSGSVTGAPKKRTMEIIDSLETEPRGVFTGCIGEIEPQGKGARFSIPIRTVVLNENEGRMGAGSGIVSDSNPSDEYREVALKGRFLTHPLPAFALIETMLYEKGEYRYLEDHLERLSDSAQYFEYPFQRDRIDDLLAKLAKNLSTAIPEKVRLLLHRNGDIRLESEPAPEQDETPVLIGISPEAIDEMNPFFYHKTTHRSFYDQEREWMRNQTRMKEVVFFNRQDELTEGTISNIFLKIQGRWFTPPVRCGLLAGVGRKKLLEQDPLIQEKVLFREDLLKAEDILLVSSLRGARKGILMI